MGGMAWIGKSRQGSRVAAVSAVPWWRLAYLLTYFTTGVNLASLLWIGQVYRLEGKIERIDTRVVGFFP